MFYALLSEFKMFFPPFIFLLLVLSFLERVKVQFHSFVMAFVGHPDLHISVSSIATPFMLDSTIN